MSISSRNTNQHTTTTQHKERIMLKKIVDMGVISAIFYYETDGDTAVIHELKLGGAEAVRFPLTDNWDIKNFSKMLSDAIDMDVVVCESEVAA